mmetsp:Transcript_15742/g.24207  ORF Transcript_15742/g.24207 Transcript_15742/m.24207 type:complete len:105 (-) Transcript_15742:165-479(-)
MSVQNRSKFGSTMRSTQSTFQTSLYATPFVLDRDVSNKYKVADQVGNTQQFTNTIPFLRAPHMEWKNVVKSPRSTSMRMGDTNRSFQNQANQTFTAGFGENSNA